ncbi:hypothetical protein QP162_20860 [Sphingomonas aurantiaca]|uniref:hypothetical protein n=1 Tax=Sphingomonas aurantiaca TaxID=185949 RepID=UPI002FE34874
MTLTGTNCGYSNARSAGRLALYGFKTFAPKELEISEDTYRPQKEGFEIGFELSASDAVRLKWAYQLGLLDVGLQTQTLHPGLLVLDEPRQQEAAEASVSGLLKTAASLAAKGSQILIATSEQLANVQQFVADLPCQAPGLRRSDHPPPRYGSKHELTHHLVPCQEEQGRSSSRRGGRTTAHPCYRRRAARCRSGPPTNSK